MQLVDWNLLAMRLHAAHLSRGIARWAQEIRLEARYRKIHECANLRNGKSPLWGHKVHGHCGVLVVREKDLQHAVRELISDVIGEKSCDAASFDGRCDGTTNAIDDETR